MFHEIEVIIPSLNALQAQQNEQRKKKGKLTRDRNHARKAQNQVIGQWRIEFIDVLITE